MSNGQGVATMCDIFRGEINSAFDTHGGNIFAAFDALEPVAHSLFERCTRSFRGVIVTSDVGSGPVPSRKKTIASSAEVAAACSEVYAVGVYNFEPWAGL